MISVVLPVYINKPQNVIDTYNCIEKMRSRTSIEFELVIVETESQRFIDDCDVYVYEAKKTNPNTSVNRGFRACSGDYVVFIGNDVEVGYSWLEAMLECFDKEDCGLASTGNNENGDVITRDEIVEKEYFSLCMLKREDAWLDPSYTYIFDDTDLMFRLITQGKKFYKNLKSICHHKPHSTYGKFCGDKEEYERSRLYFMNKWSEHKDHPMYRKFSGLN